MKSLIKQLIVLVLGLIGIVITIVTNPTFTLGFAATFLYYFVLFFYFDKLCMKLVDFVANS